MDGFQTESIWQYLIGYLDTDPYNSLVSMLHAFNSYQQRTQQQRNLWVNYIVIVFVIMQWILHAHLSMSKNT